MRLIEFLLAIRFQVLIFDEFPNKFLHELQVRCLLLVCRSARRSSLSCCNARQEQEDYERYLVHGISSVGEGGGTVNHSSQLAVSKVKMWLGVTALLLASIDIGLRSEAPIARVITKVRIEFSR